MRIFSTSAVKEIDALTMLYEPISSIDLMERASCVLTDAIVDYLPLLSHVAVFAGSGNNGGDGFVVSRLLSAKGYRVEVYTPSLESHFSDTCAEALRRLKSKDVVRIHDISVEGFPVLSEDTVIVDALFGSGLNRTVTGLYADIIKNINSSGSFVVAVDIPSGLMGEDNTAVDRESIVRADVTFTFQFPKLSMLFADNAPFVGHLRVLDIGLSSKAMEQTESITQTIEVEELLPLLSVRRRHSHKGDYGRALLVAGSYGMAGASSLAAKAAMRSGLGLLTVHLPGCNNSIVQSSVPEAITSIDSCETHFSRVPSLKGYDAVAVGPGIGRHPDSAAALLRIIEDSHVPMVIDADALNILSEYPEWFAKLPPGSVITPHPGEFSRIAGLSSGGYDALKKATIFARTNRVCVVLKGAYTAVISSKGEFCYNRCGNAGMATAGSGDVLAGIIVSLLSQGLCAYDAARLAVYVHGKAGDLAACKLGMRSLMAGDIIEHIPEAWLMLEKDQGLPQKFDF
ncbi:MAG: NAD(P)H-hydrate dehydratase [Bacteroidaceae bacterium]|nr:NAD(P)H-hydrate dehydratase [Bacteroidaceae bacterium]